MIIFFISIEVYDVIKYIAALKLISILINFIWLNIAEINFPDDIVLNAKRKICGNLNVVTMKTDELNFKKLVPLSSF